MTTLITMKKSRHWMEVEMPSQDAQHMEEAIAVSLVVAIAHTAIREGSSSTDFQLTQQEKIFGKKRSGDQ